MIKKIWRKLFPVRIITRDVYAPPMVAGMASYNGGLYIVTAYGKVLQLKMDVREQITVQLVCHVNLLP